MGTNTDQLSQLLIEADALILMLHHHREDTPVDAIKMLRSKLQLILSLTEGLDDDDFKDEMYDDSVQIANSAEIEQNDAVEAVMPHESDSKPASDSTHVIYVSDTDDPDTSQEKVSEYIEEMVEDEPATTTCNHRRPVSAIFNLNDKFRFRRELFGNSEIAYTEALNMLSAMNSLDEAKEYLFDDLNWDSNNEDVQAFVELLENYYK